MDCVLMQGLRTLFSGTSTEKTYVKMETTPFVEGLYILGELLRGSSDPEFKKLGDQLSLSRSPSFGKPLLLETSNPDEMFIHKEVIDKIKQASIALLKQDLNEKQRGSMWDLLEIMIKLEEEIKPQQPKPLSSHDLPVEEQTQRAGIEI